ncbi:hypothetical protein [Mumia sp. DW29H23]|uniref:hypothetical protein n=1 Tax=Mumia sp. DW29H23 TaxID=3421241 RepID=UPI003D692289
MSVTTPARPSRAVRAFRAVHCRLRHRDERGDVPGWVMITVMSAGLVAGLTAVAGPRLKTMLEAALTSVGG